MSAIQPSWRRRVALLGLMALAGVGCATENEKLKQEQDAVPRPDWRLGDRWLVQRSTLSGAPVILTHQVVSATTEGYTVRVLGLASEVTRQWTRDFHLMQEAIGNGPVTRYQPPVSYFMWPLKPGDTWTQEFLYTDGRNDGRYTNSWKVGTTIEPIDTVAGRFYTLRVERSSEAQRLEAYWYSPRARYFVRHEDYLRGFVEELVEIRSWSGS